MMNQKNLLLNLALGAVGVLMTVAFQNCAPSAAVFDASCNVASGCNSAASTGTTTPTTTTTTPASQLYNFVAGDQATCEASVVSRLGKSVTCTVGGGCGVSCGKPGVACLSANPSYYGACVDPNDTTLVNATPTPTPVPSSQLYNFVAGDKATCESSISSVLGRAGTCKIGGGCGITCGVPGGSCVSANPSYYGACLAK